MSINKLPANIVVRHNLRAGDIGYLTYLHGVLYAEEQGWDHRFEALVADTLGEFGKSDSSRERIWIVELDGTEDSESPCIRRLGSPPGTSQDAEVPPL